MYERIKWYKKEFVHNQYARIVEPFKDYEKITAVKMLDAIYKVYEDYNNIIDICTVRELKQIVDETDVLGHSNYSTTIIIDDEEEEEFFDYRDFDLNDNNFMSKINVNSVKDEYEEINLIDIIRIIKDRMVIYYKTDINSILKPFDYIKNIFQIIMMNCQMKK